MSKSNSILLIVIAILAIAGVFAFFYFRNSSQDSMITYHLYDAQGNEINPNQFSVVNGVPGVAQIDFGINVANTGSAPLTCTLGTLTPTAFNSAVTKNSLSVPVSQTKSWASGLISVSQFEGLTQPVSFTAPVTCTYISGTTVTLPVQTGSISLTITPDASGSFTVNVASNAGGTPTVCGNSVCETGETSASCPSDCAVSTNVKFRTLNKALDLSASDAIGVSTTCGSTLTKAGKASNSFIGTAGQTCDGLLPAMGYTKLFNVPVITSIRGGSYTSSTNPALWKKGAAEFMICADGTVPVGEYFWTGTSSGTLSNSANIINITKEITC